LKFYWETRARARGDPGTEQEWSRSFDIFSWKRSWPGVKTLPENRSRIWIRSL